MNEYEQLISLLALSMGAAWASGINLYAALLVLGIGGASGNIALPAELQIVQDPMVIGAAALMYAVEFFADKVPGVDTGWDGLHTFIRIPAGAMLAAGAVGDVSPALQIAAGLLGGGVSATSHLSKAGSRVLINTSPEPVSNWVASISEDLAVLGGLWVALNHPWLFLLLLLAFIAIAIWLLPKLWRALKTVFGKLRQWLGFDGNATNKDSSESHGRFQLKLLQQLLDEGAISEQEFQRQKSKLLNPEQNS